MHIQVAHVLRLLQQDCYNVELCECRGGKEVVEEVVEGGCCRSWCRILEGVLGRRWGRRCRPEARAASTISRAALAPGLGLGPRHMNLKVP
jgi:hypothetical protein